MQCQGTPNSTYDSSEAMINTNTKSSNTAFLWVICLIVLIASIAMISAWIYIWYPKAIVDNSKFCVPIIISLQIINLWSDINLCIEIFYKSWYQNNIFIILLGVGIIVFIFISYLINIILSKQIKSIICTNIACKYYFESKIIQPNSNNYFTNNNRYILFIFIMIITGSSWCSLLFLSSKLFGLEILNNGLTNYDLNQLLAGKKSYYFICSHTIFYNLPQILFQCLYCIVIKQITLYNAIAFVTSIITLIVFTFYYILEKQKMSFYQTIEYYVEMDAVSKREFDKNDHYIFHYQHQIMANKGKNAALLKNIKTVFGHDNDHNMEIGYTALTTYGCITHFISRIDVNDIGPRYLKESEIKNLNESEMSTFHSLLNDGPNDKNINKKIATKYVYNLFISNMDHITEVFRIHYGIDIHIKIIYHNTYPINNNDKIYHNKLQFIELYNTSLIINKRRQITKSPTSSFKKPKSPFKKARSPFKASTLSPRRIINYSPHISKTKSNDSKDNTTTRVRRTQSNPLENGAVFTIDGAKNNNIPHVRLVESDDDQNGKDIYSPAADSSETDPFNESEGRQLRRKVSDTLDENIDYTGLCVESPNNKAIKNSPRSFVGISHLALGMGRRSFSGNNPLGLNVRSKSLNHTEFGTGKSNIRILWRYDGWPEAKIVHAYKFNQNQNGMNVKEIIQQIISNDHDNEIEYEQLRYATNPTYLHGKRGWKVAYKDSFVPFLIGEDGVHEVDIWFRTKGFIHNGVGKQLK